MKIPELQFLKDKDWLDTVSNLKQLETEEDFRKALSDLRKDAKNNFSSVLQKALRKYTDASSGMLPTDLSQLQPYFDAPVDAGVLGRYQLLQSGRLADVGTDTTLVGEIAPPWTTNMTLVLSLASLGPIRTR